MTQRKPQFLVIGSQKAGTSSLFFGLKTHPQIYMPDVKEVNYFYNDDLFVQGPMRYAEFFNDAPEGSICGEASPGYLCHPRVPLRILRQVPDVKLIVTVRDPVERAYSQYWDNRRQLQESRTFDALLDDPLHQAFTPGRRNYFSRGLYSVYLERYLALFPRSQILIIQFDELKRDPQAVYRKCFEFIGVDPGFQSEEQQQIANFRSVFSNPFFRFFFNRPALATRLPSVFRWLLRWGGLVEYTPDPISSVTELRLREYFAPYDRALTELIGDPPYWCESVETLDDVILGEDTPALRELTQES